MRVAKLEEDTFTEAEAARLRERLELCRILVVSLKNRCKYCKANKITFVAPKDFDLDFKPILTFLKRSKRIKSSCISPLRRSLLELARPLYRDFVQFRQYRPYRRIHFISIPMGGQRR